MRSRQSPRLAEHNPWSRRRRTPKPAWVAFVCCLWAWVLPGHGVWGQGTLAGSVRITATASPRTVPADGKSRSRIRIELRDRADRPMPTGTPVFCHAEGGLLGTDTPDRRQSLTVLSSGGYATVYCFSETPGAATVTLRVQDSRYQVTVLFYPEGESPEAAARVVELKGGWVGYCPELNLIRVRDGARATLGSLVVDAADGLELSVDQQTLKGWGVRVTRKAEAVEGEDIFLQLGGGQGVLRRFGESGIEWLRVGAYGVRGVVHDRDLPDDAFRASEGEGVTWLVCRSLSYFVGQKVVLRHAALYAQGQKVFSFPPYWVVGLSGYSGASNTQILGVSSDGGLAVDFPLFFQVTDKWSGSIKLQRGAGGTSFVARDGWSLGLAEEYDSGAVRGALEARGLLSSDWGLELRDERTLGGDQAFFNVGWPDHRNLFSDASIYHYSKDYRFSLRGQFDSPRERKDAYSLVGDWLTEPRPFNRAADFRLGLSLGGRHSSETGRSILENELYGALDFHPWKVGRRSQLVASVTESYSWDTEEFSGNALRGDLRYTRQLGAETRLGLDYALLIRNGDTSRPGASHLLGLDLSLSSGQKWDSYLNGSWDVTAGETYAYLGLDYYVKPRWRLGLIGTHYDFEDANFSDLEFELGHTLGNRELGLRYSLDAHRLSLELGGLGLMGR